MFGEVFLQAIDSIKNNKLRTFLTMLGVVIGVASVIMIFSAGNAGKDYINNLFSEYGSNILQVSERTPGANEKKDWLTSDDIERLQKNVPQLKTIAYMSMKTAKANFNSETRTAVLTGVNEAYTELTPFDMARGRNLTADDIKAKADVAVIDDASAKIIFGNFNPIGKKIYIQDDEHGSKSFTVIGIMETGTEDLGAMMEDKPITMAVPITTLHSFYNTDRVDSIIAQVTEGEDIDAAGKRIDTILSLTHNNKEKYSITNSKQIQDAVNDVINVIQIAIMFIGALSLVVGGIGIMNIMLVAVTERTREIGIRKAIGAQKKDIIIQFLMEAVLLTGLSGVVGIICGVLPTFIIADIAETTVLSILSPWVILLAIGVSVLCGVFFGVYPAKKAADLDPIEALRYE